MTLKLDFLSPHNSLYTHSKVTEFVNFIETQSELYRTNNIILTMGGDFTYMEAQVYYENLDKLIR